jgi:hypothetical protein
MKRTGNKFEPDPANFALDASQQDLHRELAHLVESCRASVATRINSSTVILYWMLGGKVGQGSPR